MSCSIVKDNKGKIIKVLAPDTGKESKLFNKIARLPHVESLEQAVDIYDEILKANPQEQAVGGTSLFSLEDSNNKYNSFQEALGQTNSKTIDIVSNGKVVASMPTTLDERTVPGVVNAMILEGVISDNKIVVDGQTFYQIDAKTEQERLIKEEFLKEELKGILPKRGVKIKNGAISLTNPKIEESREGTVHKKVLDSVLGFYSSETRLSKKEKINEDNLKLNLFKILSDMGVSVLDLKSYQDRFKIKSNDIPPNAEALADIVNRVIAFKDGHLTTENLTEEVMHLIVETLPQEQVDGLRDFILESQEYKDNYDNYDKVYKGDQKLLEKEILGKILKNIALNKVGEKPGTFLGRLYSILKDFFNNLKLSQKHREQLKELNGLVETLVIQQNAPDFTQDSLAQSKEIALMYSLSDQVATGKNSFLNTFINLTEKRQFEGYKNELRNTSLEGATDEKLIAVVGSYIEMSNKLIDATEAALIEAEKTGKGLSGQNYVMLENLESDIANVLGNINSELGNLTILGNNEKDILSKKLLENITKINKLNSSNNTIEDKQVDRILEEAMSQYGEKEKEFYKEQMKKAIRGQMEDVSQLFSFFGQLHHSSNPILNLIGAKVWEKDMVANQGIKEDLAELQNKMDLLGWKDKDLEVFFDSNGELINQIKQTEFQAKLDRIDMELFNELRPEDKFTDVPRYMEAKLKGELPELTQEESGKYKKELQERQDGVSETYLNPKYYRNPKGNNIGLFDKYEKLGISGATISFLRGLSSARTAIKRESTVDGKVVVTPKSKADLNSISKTRRVRKNPYAEEGTLKKGLGITTVQNKEQDSVPLNTGGYLTIDRENADISAVIAFDLHKLDDSFEGGDNGKTNIGDLLDYFRSLEGKYSEEHINELILSNLDLRISQRFYAEIGEDTFLQGEEIIRENPGKLDEIEALRKLFFKKSQLIAANRNSSSPVEVDKMSEVDMETVRRYSLEIRDLMRNLKIPDQKGDDISEQRPNQSYKEYLKDKGIEEGTEQELQDLITNSHSSVTDMGPITIAFEKSEANLFLTKPESNLMAKYKGNTLLETKLNYAKGNLHSYFKRFAPKNYKTIRERVSEGENLLEVLHDLNSNDPYINISIDRSFDGDSEKTNKETFSEISGQSFESTEDFLEKKENGQLKKLSEKENERYKELLFERGYVKNPDFNENYDGGFRQPKKGTYVNEKYQELFAPDSQGNPTKNKEAFEIRELYLKAKKTALEKQDSSHVNVYKPIQISKTVTEQLRDIVKNSSTLKEKWASIIEFLKERFAYRVDDKAYGETDFKNNKKLVKYYVQDLENQNDVSTDHMYALVQLVSRANHYKASKEVISDIESLHNLLVNKKPNRKNKLEQTVKMAESYIDSAIYGKIEQVTKEFKILGTQYSMDLAKIARSFTKYVSLKNLGYSFPIAVTGYTTGLITKKVEEFIGEKLNKDAARLASAEYKKLKKEFRNNALTVKVNDNSKLFLIGQAFGIYNISDKARNAKFGAFQRGLSKSAMAVHAMADFPITPKIMLGVLYDNRFINGKRYNRQQYFQEKTREEEDVAKTQVDWTNAENKSVYEYMNFTETGFRWDKSVYKELKKQNKNITDPEIDIMLKGSKNFINRFMSNEVSNIQGQIPQQMRVTAQRHALGSMMMLHKGFASIILQRKFKTAHLNPDTGLYEEGTYRTLGRLMNSFLGNPVKLSLNQPGIKEFFKEPDKNDFMNNGKLDEAAYNEAWLDYELRVRNKKRIIKEMGTLMSMAMIFSLIFAATEDEDNEDYYLLGMTNYIMHRTLNEAGTNLSFGIVGDVIDTIESPFVTYRPAIQMLKAWELFDGKEIKSNKYKGLSKRQRYLTRNVIGAKTIYDLHDAKTIDQVKDTYKMYNKESINWSTLSLFGLLNDDKKK